MSTQTRSKQSKSLHQLVLCAVLIALAVTYFILRNKGKINFSRKNKNRAARE